MTCKPKKILMTGARSPTALDLARLLHAGGHEVYAADTSHLHVTRFSNAVKDSFIVPVPSKDPKAFIDHVLAIIEQEEIDFYLPVWEEVLYVSKALDRFPKSCEVFCDSFEIIHRLHSKKLFIELLDQLGFPIPKTILVNSQEEIRQVPLKKPFMLKASYGRACREVIKIDSDEIPNIPFSPSNPWVAQEFLEGERFCSYSVCHNGKVLAHSTYPVKYTLPDKSSCVAYESYDHPKITEWVHAFIGKINLTGHAAFDFIETADGTLYCIECNPRATSGIHLFQRDDGVDRAYLNQLSETKHAEIGFSKQIGAGMTFFGLKNGYSEGKFWDYAKKLVTTRDVVLDLKDIKPFIFQPIVFLQYFITSIVKRSTIPVIFTDDFDWKGELELGSDESVQRGILNTEAQRHRG